MNLKNAQNAFRGTVNPWGRHPVKTRVTAIAKQPARRIRIDTAVGHKAGVTYEVYDPKVHKMGGAS